MIDVRLSSNYVSAYPHSEDQLIETESSLKPGMKLPFEIFGTVMDYTDQGTKLALGHTCKGLNRIASHKLQKNILVVGSEIWYRNHPDAIKCWTGFPIIPSVSQRRFYNQFTVTTFSKFMGLLDCNPGKSFPIEILIFDGERSFNENLVTVLSSILPNTVIFSNDTPVKLPKIKLQTKTIHTFQVSVTNDLTDLSCLSSIKNLSIDGAHLAHHNPNVTLPNCTYRCLHVKNNEHIRFKSASGERIKVKSLVLEGTYDISLSTLIDESSVEQLHIDPAKFGYNLKRFENLRDLSVNRMYLSDDFVINKNVLRFLKIKNRQDVCDVNHILSYPFVMAHRESLEQIIWTDDDPIFWYEISVFTRCSIRRPRHETIWIDKDQNFPKLVHISVHYHHYYLARLHGIHYKTFNTLEN